MKTGAASALLVVMATALGTAFADSPPRPPPPPPPPSGLEPPPLPPGLEARSLHLTAPPPPSYPSGGTPFLEYGPPPGRTTPPPPPEKHLKYEAIGEPHIKWSHATPQHINVLYAPAPVAYSPPPPPPPPTLPPYKYQTARPLPPPVTSPPQPPPPSPPPPPQKPAVRPHLVYGPPPQVQEHQPSLPAPPPPPPPPQLPYASTGEAALPEAQHRFSLQPAQHHTARHFVKRATDNAIDTYIYRYVDDGSSFNKYGQLQLNAHDKTLGKFAYRYVGSDGVTVDVSRRPA